jgi:hypothetical protein
VLCTIFITLRFYKQETVQLAVSLFVLDISTLKMTSEKSVDFWRTRWRRISEDGTFHSDCSEDYRYAM